MLNLNCLHQLPRAQACTAVLPACGGRLGQVLRGEAASVHGIGSSAAGMARMNRSRAAANDRSVLFWKGTLVPFPSTRQAGGLV